MRAIETKRRPWSAERKKFALPCRAYRIGTKRVSNTQVTMALYFVPMASPAMTPERIRNLFLNPLSAHFNRRKSEAKEKNRTPRSTYAEMDSLTMMGMERKNTTPNKAKGTLVLLFKYPKRSPAVSRPKLK